MLPTFIIAGAPRCGTTSLYRYCAQHPEIYMSPIKEVNYFSTNYHDWSEHDYRQLFEPGRNKSAVGEASPSYLRQEEGPQRIASLIPECQIIVILRDPVSRFLSDFKYSRRFGFHSEPLSEYLPIGSEKEVGVPDHFRIRTMKRKGFYAKQLRQYRNVIGDGQVHTFLYDDLVTDAPELIRTLFEVLDVDPEFSPRLQKKHNRSMESRWPTLARWTRGGLVESAVRRIFHRTTADRTLSAIRHLNSRPSSFVPSKASVQQVREWYGSEIREVEKIVNRPLDDWLTSWTTYIEE